MFQSPIAALEYSGLQQPLHFARELVGQEFGEGSARRLSLGYLMQLSSDAGWGCGPLDGSPRLDVQDGILTSLATDRCWLEAQLGCRLEHLHVASLAWSSQGTRTSSSPPKRAAWLFLMQP